MSLENIMYNFFGNFDIALDIYGEEDDKRAEEVKTLIQNNELTIANIRKDTNAIIALVTHGTYKQYDGFNVEIIHKSNGKITSKYFGFVDYMPINCQVGNETNRRAFSINANLGDKWYGSSPSYDEKQKMVRAIMKYIGLWV